MKALAGCCYGLNRYTCPLLWLMLLVLPEKLGASGKSVALRVQVTVVAACSVNAGAPGEGFSERLDFASQGSLGSPLSAAGGGVRIRCAPGIAYSVTVGHGQHNEGNQRRLQGPGGELVSYGLYRDAALSIAWDERSPLSTSAEGEEQWFPIHGLIVPQATPVAGVYRDRVEVIIKW